MVHSSWCQFTFISKVTTQTCKMVFSLEPTASSRICSLHFRESDFVTEKRDRNKLKRKNETTPKLVKRYLRSNAVPSQFPNLPSYFNFEPTPNRDDSSTSTVRLRKDNERIKTSIDELEKADIIDNLTTLKLKFEACSLTPSNFVSYARTLMINWCLRTLSFVLKFSP